MTSLFEKNNTDLKNEEYVLKYALVHLGLRKLTQDKVEKIK
jgi:hypothetical protein